MRLFKLNIRPKTKNSKSLKNKLFVCLILLTISICCNFKAAYASSQVAAGENHTVGLRSDGKVVAVGDNSYSQCDLVSWSNIIQVW